MDAPEDGDDDGVGPADEAPGTAGTADDGSGTDEAPGTAGAADDSSTDGAPGTADGGDGADEEGPTGLVGWLGWFWTTDSSPTVYARDVLTSVGAVLLVGLILFAISGVWPPMVAVESGSMEPNMERGDLVFVVDNERYVPDAAPGHDGASTGVVPADRGADVDRTKFGRHGDVIVFMPRGDGRRTPVIHRAMLWVEGGENWYDRADPDAVGGAQDCESLDYCPAPHAGFITKGDNDRTNSAYDQVTGLTPPVRPDWVIGTAEVRVPYLGHVRLAFSEVAPAGGPAAVASPPPSALRKTAPSAPGPATVDTPAPLVEGPSPGNATASPAPGPRQVVRGGVQSRACSTQSSARPGPTSA